MADYTQYLYIDKRVRYFDGEFLKDQDFIDEQKYHIDRQRRLDQFLRVSGVCDGLTLETSTNQVIVTPGTALDSQGRQIILSTNSPPIDLSSYRDQQVYLVISYQEEQSDHSTEGGLGSSGARRWHEKPNIQVAALGNVPEDSVVLAKLAINRSGVVTPDFTVRQYSGVRLPSGNLSNGEITGPILRSDGNSTSSLVILDGDLSVSGKGNSSFAGSLGIGITEPNKKLHVERGELRVRASHNNKDADIGTFYANNLSQGIGIGYNRIEAIGNNTNQDINIIPKGSGQVIVNPGKLTVSAGQIQLDGAQQIVFTNSDTSNNLKLQLWNGYGLGINGGTLFYASASKHSWRDANGTNERMVLTTAANGGLTVKGTGNSSFAGNLGIGTTNPGSSKLKVQGNLTVSAGQIQLDGAQQIVFTNSDTTNNLKLQLWGGYGLGINSGTLFYAANGKHSWRDANGTNERMVLTTAANGGLTVKGTGNSSFAGNLGIGTTNPGSSKLKVQGNLTVSAGQIQLDGAQQIVFTNKDTSNNLKLQLWGGYGLGINNQTLFYAANGNHSWRDTNGTNERMALSTAANGGLTVKGTGNSSFAGSLGIGTTDPGSSKLKVQGNLTVTGNATLESLTLNDNFSLGGSNTLGFGSQARQMINLWEQDYGIGIQNSTQYFRTNKNFAWYKDGSHNDGELNAGGGTVQMVIKDGNVGIGTTNPNQMLDVVTSTSYNNRVVGRFYRPAGDTAALIECGDGNEAFIQFKNQNTGGNSWMVGMDDEQFKIAYGSSEITDANQKFTVEQDGDIKVNGKKPFEIKKFGHFYNNYDTGYSTSDWEAVIAGFRALSGDINEGDRPDIIQVYTYINGNRWYIYADFASHVNEHEHWYVWVLFIRKELVSFVGSR
ncbi:hypothetical protein BJP36_24120 [Moorena producens JHB]|uniref:Uncharacterized protein n=1 Tax=Moorena producens (strain JHB) TaxID=1454205 RepID=A0A1D9G546_MOOP1|nr:hypothetical protein [Moorena producens]AOY82540.2 hypothetical protein BJP36_24120 [Moorena producens JHB]